MQVHNPLLPSTNYHLVTLSTHELANTQLLGRRAPALTPLIPPPRPQKLLLRQLQLSLQHLIRLLPVNKVTEPGTHTPLPAIQPTARLPKVRDGAQLAINRTRRIPAGIEVIARLLRVLLVLESGIDIANQVVVVVVAHDHLLDFAVLGHLAEEVFVEGIEVVLELGGVHFVFRVEGGVLVQVGKEDCLAVAGLDVFAGAAVAVAAGADFVVEGAIDFVLLCSEDGGEITSHGE